MRKPPAIGLLSLLLGLAALLAAPQTARAQDEVKLGAFLPISGISADVGAQMKAGTEVALERMATLQVGGKPMKVRVISTTTRARATSGSTWSRARSPSTGSTWGWAFSPATCSSG
jgi:hypothetical protein